MTLFEICDQRFPEILLPQVLVLTPHFDQIFSCRSAIPSTWIHGSRFDYPWLWLFITGGLAWLVTLFSFTLLNLTPLCVGQDNGDGINDLGLCFLYTFLIVLIYSPIELVVLLLSAFAGGKILRALIRG